MNICIFCSARDIDAKYTDPAKELVTELVKRGHTIVYGASDIGLMKTIIDTAQAHNGKAIGVTYESIANVARKNLQELIVEKNIGDRQVTMSSRSDAFILLPGGIESINEMTTIWVHKKWNIHQKPVVVLNSAGYYDGLKLQLETMDSAGFLFKPLDQVANFVDTPAQVWEHLKA